MPYFIEPSLFEGCLAEVLATKEIRELPLTSEEAKLYNTTMFVSLIEWSATNGRRIFNVFFCSHL